MNAETLNIKLKLELGTLLNDVKKVKTQLGGMASTVKNSIPKISTESKKAKDALGGVTKASNNVKRAIEGIGDEAKDSLSTITSQSNKAAQALQSIRMAGRNVNSSLDADGVAESTDGATASLEEMQGTMQAIIGMDFVGLFISNFDKIKANAQAATSSVVEGFKGIGKAIKDAVSDFELVGKIDKLSLKFMVQDVTAITKSFVAAGAAAAKAVIPILSLAGAVSAVALAVNALGVSKLGEEIYHNAQRAGMSAQAYQEWTYVMERAGIEANELTEIVKTLTEAQVDVLDGSEDVINAFQKLGMSASDVAGMGQDELWNNTIAALQNVENATERTAIAYKIFGEDALKLTTILNLSNADTQKLISTYNQLGGAMSKELITNSAVLQNSLGNLRVAWQGLRNTLAQAVLPALITVVNWITKAIVVVNVFLQKFFNLDLTPATDNMTGGITGATGAIGGYEDAITDATTAVEKLKRTTMGFDELNIVGNPNTGSAGSTGGSGGSGGGADIGSMVGATDSIFTEASKQAEEFEKKVMAFMDKWSWAIKAVGAALGALTIRNLLVKLASAVGLGEQLAKILSFAGIKEGITKAATAFGTFFTALKGGEGIAAAFAAAFPKVSAALTSVTTAASGALAAIGGIFGLSGGAAIAAGAAVVAAAIAAVTSVVIYLKNNWDDVTAAVQGFFAENIEPKLESIRDSLSQMIPPEVLEALKNMWQGIKDIVGAIGEWFASIDWIEKIGAVFEAVGGIIFNTCAGVIAGAINGAIGWVEGFNQKIVGIKNIISGVVGGITAIFRGDLPTAKKEFSKVFDGIKTYLTGWYNTTIGVVVNFVKGVGDWFAKLYPAFGKVWDKIKKMFSDVGSAIAQGVTGAVRAAVNAVLRTVVDKINTFIGWINGAVDLINKIPGVSIGKLSRLSVPQLATGGIVTSETLARIGERGKKEAVLPLEQHTGWMDTLADKINSRGGSDRPIHVHVDVDGNELGWAVIHSINNITRQTGGLQLAL